MTQHRFQVFPLLAAVMCVAAGLALRRYGYSIGLTFPVVKYGASVIWGSMVYFLALSVLPHTQRLTVALAAGAFSIVLELFRLFHTDALDAFRLTTIGALLLGRVFSFWNIAAYLAGIGLACAVSAWLGPAASPSSAPSAS